MSVTNGAGRVVVFGLLQRSVTRPRPLFANAFPSMMNGGGPVKMPTLRRRSWKLVATVGGATLEVVKRNVDNQRNV